MHVTVLHKTCRQGSFLCRAPEQRRGRKKEREKLCLAWFCFNPFVYLPDSFQLISRELHNVTNKPICASNNMYVLQLEELLRIHFEYEQRRQWSNMQRSQCGQYRFWFLVL